jgi:hypothetical protein
LNNIKQQQRCNVIKSLIEKKHNKNLAQKQFTDGFHYFYSQLLGLSETLNYCEMRQYNWCARLQHHTEQRGLKEGIAIANKQPNEIKIKKHSASQSFTEVIIQLGSIFARPARRRPHKHWALHF